MTLARRARPTISPLISLDPKRGVVVVVGCIFGNVVGVEREVQNRGVGDASVVAAPKSYHAGLFRWRWTVCGTVDVVQRWIGVKVQCFGASRGDVVGVSIIFCASL